MQNKLVLLLHVWVSFLAQRSLDAFHYSLSGTLAAYVYVAGLSAFCSPVWMMSASLARGLPIFGQSINNSNAPLGALIVHLSMFAMPFIRLRLLHVPSTSIHSR